MARVNGRPQMVSERYLGTAAEVEALLDARESALLAEGTRHLAFGDRRADGAGRGTAERPAPYLAGRPDARAALEERGAIGDDDNAARRPPATVPPNTGSRLEDLRDTA